MTEKPRSEVDPDVLRSGDALVAALAADPSDEVSRLVLADLMESEGVCGDASCLRQPGHWEVRPPPGVIVVFPWERGVLSWVAESGDRLEVADVTTPACQGRREVDPGRFRPCCGRAARSVGCFWACDFCAAKEPFAPFPANILLPAPEAAP